MVVSSPTSLITPLASPTPSPKSSSYRSRTLDTDGTETVCVVEGEVPPTPMWLTLLECATSAGAWSAQAAKTGVATNNNPRPMRSKFSDGAEYWLTTSGDILTLKFPAVLQTSGQPEFTHIGPYFNMPFAGLDLAVLRKAKAQFEIRALETADDMTDFPPEAIECSRVAFETIMALGGELEEVRNKNIAVTKRPGCKPFWREKDDHYVLVISTEALFKDLPTKGNPPVIQRSNIGKSTALLSPRKVREATKRKGGSSVPSTPKKTGRGTKTWFISDLPDPDGRYAELLAEHGQDLDNVKVISPDVRACNLAFVHAGEYDAFFNDGDIVEVEVMPKVWFIKSDKPGNADNGTRVYQLILKSMKVFPYDGYLKKEKAQEISGKGKRKASDAAVGASPSKKVAVNDDHDMVLGEDEF